MKRTFCRFTTGSTEEARYGEVLGEMVAALNCAPWQEECQPLRQYELSAVEIEVPLQPSKIICVGRNYAEHAAELGNDVPKEPLLFLKAPSSLLPHGGRIKIPELSQQVEYEGEIGVVIGKKVAGLSEDQNPLDYVFGFTCLNDITARDIQRRDVQFTRGKSFDTFCPVGPFVVSGLKVDDMHLETILNGESRQRGLPGQMVFSIPFLVAYISRMMTLEPGDLIATGTPSGVGRIVGGDTVEVKIAGVGNLVNSVI